MKLYNYWRSSASWRVRWALELKKISFEYIPINLLKNEQNDPSFLQKNPLGAVPCLEVMPGVFISESLAILEWLEESFPKQGLSLFPSSTTERAVCRQLFEIVNSGTMPLTGPMMLARMFPGAENETRRKEWMNQYLERGLKAYDQLSSKYRGRYSVGDQLTIADLALIPQIYSALRFNFPVETKFPKLFEIYNLCLESTECKKAHPASQIDTQAS